MEEEMVISLECKCGFVFELEDEEVDGEGERWARCPKCKGKVPVPVVD